MKKRWLFGLASGVLAAAMCVSFVGCTIKVTDPDNPDIPGPGPGPSTTDQTIANNAISTIRSLYESKDGSSTPTDYTVIGRTKVGDDFYTVEWTVTSEVETYADYVSVGTMDTASSQVTIHITRGELEVPYTLKATVKVKQASATASFSHTIPAEAIVAQGDEEFDFSGVKYADYSATSYGRLDAATALTVLQGSGSEDSLLETVDEAKNIYTGSDGTSGGIDNVKDGYLKFGKSGDSGKLTLTFSKPISKVSLVAQGWKDGSGATESADKIDKISVNGSTAQTPSVGETSAHTFEFDPAYSVTIETTYRAFIFKISITYAPDGAHIHRLGTFTHDANAWTHTATCSAENCTAPDGKVTQPCEPVNNTCSCGYTYQPAEILKRLTSEEEMKGTYELTGVVTGTPEPGNSGNYKFNITVEGTTVIAYYPKLGTGITEIKEGDTVTIQGTLVLYGESKTPEFSSGTVVSVNGGTTPEPGPGPQPDEKPAPEAGDYNIVLRDKTNNLVWYVTGTIGPKGGLVVDHDASKAATITVSIENGRYFLKIGNQYLEAYLNVSYKNMRLVNTPSADAIEWKWNTDYGTFSATYSDETRYLGGNYYNNEVDNLYDNAVTLSKEMNFTGSNPVVIYYEPTTPSTPEPEPAEGPLEIKPESLKVLNSSASSEYDKYAGTHTVNNYQVTVSGVYPSKQGTYNFLMIRKNDGTLTVTGTFTKITVYLLALDSTEDYLLSVTAGTTKLTANIVKTETTTIKDGSNAYNLYTIEYVVDTTGEQQFTLTAGQKAARVTSIMFGTDAVEPGGGGSQTAKDRVDAALKSLTIEQTSFDAMTETPIDLPTQIGTVNISWEVVGGNTANVSITDNKLSILSLPEVDAVKVMIKATLSEGDESAEKSFEITVNPTYHFEHSGTSIEDAYTVAEALVKAGSLQPNAYSGLVYVKGYVIKTGTYYSDTKSFGYVYIADSANSTDKSEDAIQVYKLYLDQKFIVLSGDLIKGAQITIYGYLQNYKSANSDSTTPEINAKSGDTTHPQAVAYTVTEEQKAQAALDALIFTKTVTSDITLTSTVTGVTFTATSENSAISGVTEAAMTITLKVTRPDSSSGDATGKIVIVAHCGSVTKTLEKEITVSAVLEELEPGATGSITWDASKQGFGNAEKVAFPFSVKHITFEWDKKGTAPAFYTNAVRFYKNSKLTISVPTGYKITSIEITLDGSLSGTANVGEFKSGVWSGSPVQSVEISFTGTTKCQKFVVTYQKDAATTAVVNTMPEAILPTKEN